jgi:hypothetical protein
MRTLLMRALIGTSLLFGGLAAANAQYESPRVYEHRDQAQFLDRVRADLDRAEAATLPDTGDRGRINAVRDEVNMFSRRLADGNYDRAALDNAISGMQRVVDINRMSDRTRDMMSDDLARLRDMRVRMDRESSR